MLFGILTLLLADALMLCKALFLYRLAASEARDLPNGADLAVPTDSGEILAASAKPAAAGPVSKPKTKSEPRVSPIAGVDQTCGQRRVN